MREHNNLWCEMSADTAIPDGQRNCSLCGAILHELTIAEAIRLVDMFEEIALKRTRAESWEASDWLFDDEADALVIAKKTAVSGRR
jgi:hypothetical protein